MQLPTPKDIRTAVEIYLQNAYLGPTPEHIADLLPPEGDFDPADWFAHEMVERDPANASPDELRSAAFRLGNTFYPNMKLRIARPPKDKVFLFSVDSHDAVLQAPEGSPDHKMLEELKAHNAQLAETIHRQWDDAGILTEKNYLRWKIQQTKKKQAGQSDK